MIRETSKMAELKTKIQPLEVNEEVNRPGFAGDSIS